MRNVLIFIVSMLICSGAQAGTLSLGFLHQIDGRDEGEQTKALLILQDQVDVDSLDEHLKLSRASLAQRHRLVVQMLQDEAARKQQPLLDELSAQVERGFIKGFTSHWLINSVVVEGSIEAIRRLAERSDVAYVEADIQTELIEPMPERKSVSNKDRGIGIPPGLRAIRAPEVWYQLGVRGQGVVVGNIDTGVDASHPALASRWRGASAPVAECWLDAAGAGSAEFPQDGAFGGGHGTHVMGTITGLAPGDSIGIAPEALWIAANPIMLGISPEFDMAILASLEFMTDPDGDPDTISDVPSVVMNSWGIAGGYLEYGSCDTRWWNAIDNCEAAGVILIWAAGNEGALGSETIRQPANRADTPGNCFSVGSTTYDPPYQVSSFSSRGPSSCGGQDEIKPEVCAPGEWIYSSGVGGDYILLSGTSMAGPHVAGVAALMRSANPDIEVDLVKEILISTAIDRGFPGEDNSYGHGSIDAYAAVLEAMQPGYICGRVLDATTGMPVFGAHVEIVGAQRDPAITDIDGNYHFIVVAGAYNLAVTSFGFESRDIFVVVLNGQTQAPQTSLTPTNRINLSGTVYDAQGDPVSGAVVECLSVIWTPVSTDDLGNYFLDLPGPLSYELRALAPGWSPDVGQVELNEPSVLDFRLQPQVFDGFESGDFENLSWQNGGDAFWEVDGFEPNTGSFSARAGVISNDQNSDLSIHQTAASDDRIAFSLKVSSENNYDTLLFLIDGIEAARFSGEVAWRDVEFPVAAGAHNFTWSYRKDSSVGHGSDTAWIDDVFLPAGGVVSAVENMNYPSNLILYEGVPNPFNPTVEFKFRMHQLGEVQVSVFDVSGRKVRNLIAGTFAAGEHSVKWNGHDDSGRLSASGTYFVRLNVGTETVVRAVTMIK